MSGDVTRHGGPKAGAPFGGKPSPEGMTSVAVCDAYQRWVTSAGEPWVLGDRRYGRLDARRITGNKDVLDVAESLHRADANALRVMYSDLCSDISLAVESEQLDGVMARVTEPLFNLTRGHPRLVVVAHDNHVGPHCLDDST